MSAIRFGGLASGIDTESIIKQLMDVERMKVDKVAQNKQLSLWRQEQYQEVNSKLANFIIDSKVALGLANISSNGSLLNTSVNSVTWAKSATSSNEDAASVSANSGAAEGTYQIKINSLASNWSSASSASLGSGEDITSLASQFGLGEADNIKFTITTNSGEVIIDKLAGDTDIDEIVSEINSSGIGVKAIYDSGADRFFLQTENTGAENTISITDESTTSEMVPFSFIAGNGNILKLQHQIAEGVYDYVDSATEYSGVDANIDFGAAIGISFSSNDFTLNNIRFSLKETTTTSFNISVNPDIDTAYEKIRDFVDKYNELVDELDSIVSQKKQSDYLPLTETQKDEMTDKEIELWEEKAKTGLLSNDSIIMRIGSRARSGFYEIVEGVSGSFSHLTEIGITTEVYSGSSAGGRLEIDEQSLRTALQEDMDGVLQLFFKEPELSLQGNEDNLTAEQISEKRAQSGLVNRLFDNITSGIKEVLSKAGPGNDSTLLRKVSSFVLLKFVTEQSSISTLDKGILDYNERISNLERILAGKEEAYWKRYTAMEKAISQMDTQMAWLNQQLGQS